MSSLKMEGLKSLRKTLMGGSQQILNDFKRRVTNGKTEGLNRKANLIQRAAYGFKKFDNYRFVITLPKWAS
jgi:transposase